MHAGGNVDLSMVLNHLKRKGYAMKFTRDAASLYSYELKQWIKPQQFTVDEAHLFEGNGNPDADRMLYAVSLSQQEKGYFVDACHVYTDSISSDMLLKLTGNHIRYSHFY